MRRVMSHGRGSCRTRQLNAAGDQFIFEQSTMGRQGRQVLAAGQPLVLPDDANMLTMESMLAFDVTGTEAELWPMSRLLVRLGGVFTPDESWQDLPARFDKVVVESCSVMPQDLPSRIYQWLSASADQYPISVIVADPLEVGSSSLGDVVGILRKSQGEIHLVSERPLSSREQAMSFDSVVRAEAGHAEKAAARLFTALSSDAAELLWSCRDHLDWQLAYGSASYPSRMIEAWWCEADGLVFGSARDRSAVETSTAVVATVYDHGKLQCRWVVSTLRELLGELSSFSYGTPVGFLHEGDFVDSDLRRVHLLCATRPDENAAT